VLRLSVSVSSRVAQSTSDIETPLRWRAGHAAHRFWILALMVSA